MKDGRQANGGAIGTGAGMAIGASIGAAGPFRRRAGDGGKDDPPTT